MMIVPAAMFAMFFFLSLFVQNIMGYTPLHTGFAFLPFSFGIVIAAAIASKLIDPGRPAVARRRRHGDGRARTARLLETLGRRPARRPSSRRPRRSHTSVAP